MPFRRDVWRIDRAGSLERLTRRTEDLADPAPGEARIAVKAIGLNFADIFACLGLYSATPQGSFIPGLEFAGVVERLGPPVGPAPAFREGDAVMGLTRFGGYATAINAGVPYLRRVPDGWSWAQAAAFPVQALTAWYGLVRLGALRPGHVVLVQSAAGGVGLNALSIAASMNDGNGDNAGNDGNDGSVRVVAVVGREDKKRWLVETRGLSPGTVVVRDRRTFGADLDRALAAMNAPGFDLVFDAVAGPFLRPAFQRLRPGGRLVVYGAADFMAHGPRANYPKLAWQYLTRPRIDPLSMIDKNRSVIGFNLIWLWERAGELSGAFEELRVLIPDPPFVNRVMPFADAPAAMRHLQSGESIGKVVVEV